jgi:hypothetical protein
MQTVRLPRLESATAVWDFLESLFEELRCENFYEKGLVEARDNGQYGTTTPKMHVSELPAAVAAAASAAGSAAGLSAKRKSGDKSSLGSTPSKQPRLVIHEDMPLAAVKKSAANAPNSRQVNIGGSGNQVQQQSRPRGRPAGSKNKTTGESKRASQQQQEQPPNSPSKKLPIYHNAHKIYHQPQQNQLQPPMLRPEVATATATTMLSVTPSPITAPSNYNSNYARRQVNLSDDYNQVPSKIVSHVFDKVSLPPDPNDWTIGQVIGHITMLDQSLENSVEMFKAHEIDGKALGLLTSEMMMKYMDMKLGPALKICNIVDMIQGKKHMPLANWDE